MNLEQLKSFCTVAELGSFSRAGEARFLAQSTVSTQIAALERELGVRLFDRLGWRVLLTDAGEQFLRYAVRILSQVDEARQEMENIHGLVSGKLVVGASHTVGNYLVPALFGRFNAQYPGVRLVLEIAISPRTADRVSEGRVDVGLVEARVYSPDLKIRPFLTDELVLVVSPQHRWAQRGEIEPSELSGEPFVALVRGSITRRIVEAQLKAQGVTLNTVTEMETPEAIRNAVQAGLGVSILSRHVLDLALSAGVLAEVRLKGLHLERELYVLLHAEKHPSPALAAFLEMVG